ncbi:hypothetical protein ACP275_07G069600 [Erythranthe tilingii]
MEVVNSNEYKHGEDDEAGVLALAACLSHTFPMALAAAIDLDLFEIISGAGDGAHMSASDIAAQLPSAADGAAAVLDAMLQLLASHSLLICSTNVLADGGGAVERRYGIAPAGKFFVKDESGVSFAQFHSVVRKGGEIGFSLKDAVIEGDNQFEKICAKSFYEFITSNVEATKMFNDGMRAHSSVIIKKVVKTYQGFEGLSCLVDVGGGSGSSLATIVSKYPSIRGVNFDLPHIIETAPTYNGIEHIGGDMFVEVPKGDAILLKFILHNWGDEKCGNLLNNCYKSLPNNGKLIVMDYILPNTHQDDIHAKYASQMNLMMSCFLEGKERTKEEFEGMAKKAGFGEFKVVCYVYGMWVMEFIKDV